MKPSALRRLAPACVAALSLALSLWPSAPARAQGAAGKQTAAAAPADLNLLDFGATGDGTTDDSAALQSALDALAAAGGGTLTVPAGRYVIATSVKKDFTGLASAVTIQGVPSSTTVNTEGTPSELAAGLDLDSEFYPRTGTATNALTITGLQTLLVKDLAFVGTPNKTTDAVITLSINSVEAATVRHCEFYGLSSIVDGGAIVRAVRSNLSLEQSKFLGSVANSGYYSPVVENLVWKGLRVSDVVFLDYGLRPELYGKTGYAAPFGWINVGNAAAVTPDSPRREVSINRLFLDEGGFVGLIANPARHPSPPSAPIDLYYITALRMNVSNLATTGNYLSGLKGVMVESSRYIWSRNADSAITLVGVGSTILDRVYTEAHATRLRADAACGRLTVINSVYEDLASQAKTTRVINTEQDSDDPVSDVRQRFEASLARDPDPAAHFYWSEQLLQCADGDATCVEQKRADLDAYLASSPLPTFDLSGRVTDETGAGVPGASVALKGSQTVTALTDAAGDYRFRGLPTSGAYTVTASKPFHTFAAPTQTFTTPNGDRTADFSCVVSRHSVSGKLTDNTGAALANTAVLLSGGRTASANTDASGNYAFTGLPDGASYTVTPSRLGHSFSPGATTVASLTANVVGNFVGTPGSYRIAGRVTTGGANPAGVGGVAVTLSGSRAGTVNTDASGNYAFTGLPAGGNYTVAAAKDRYGLTPAGKSFTNLAGDQTLDFTAAAFVNHALAARGSAASASSVADAGRDPLSVINGDRRGLHYGSGPSTGSGWRDNTPGDFPDWVEIDFPGPRSVQEVSLYSLQDNYDRPIEPTAATAFTRYGVTGAQVQYWTGTAWAAVPDGLFTGNNKVWKKLTFAPLLTTKIRVLVNAAADAYSRFTEVEAWGLPPAPRVNYALASNGSTASATSQFSASRPPVAAINGDRKGLNWGAGDPSTGSGWTDNTQNVFPDRLEVTFPAARTIDEIDVFTLQDNHQSPVEPTEALTFSKFGVTSYLLEYWNGSAYVQVPGATVSGNNKVWRRFAFSPLSTTKIRLTVTGALAGYSRVVELEAWGEPPSGP